MENSSDILFIYLTQLIDSYSVQILKNLLPDPMSQLNQNNTFLLHMFI